MDFFDEFAGEFFSVGLARAGRVPGALLSTGDRVKPLVDSSVPAVALSGGVSLHQIQTATTNNSHGFARSWRAVVSFWSPMVPN